MKKLYTLIILFFATTVTQAQITLLDETMLTQSSFNTFTAVNVTGTQVWSHSAQYGAVCSGFASGQSFANEDWLISAPMDLTQMNNVKLNFSHTRGNAAVMNIGVAQGWYKAYATANYTGSTATTTWVELTGLNQNVPNAWTYISSGALEIPAAAKSATTRIAFRYESAAGQSATWEIKNVKVTGEQAGMTTFKITNWNTEWLGCTQFGPNNETQQLANVASAMLTMNSDIYCMQEVSNTTTTTTIASLVALLGIADWGGTIVPSDTGDCNQRQAIIYKKSKVQFTDAWVLNNGNWAQGNSYNYNWSTGRFPAMYNVKLIAGSNLIPLSLVNIHAKAEDGQASSYTRRLGGSQSLKTILDNEYGNKNIILLGDFNDYLIGTTSDACNCTVSPFKNFMDDTANYTGITQNMFDDHWNRPLIEHFILSNEIIGSYVPNSAVQEEEVPATINNFYNTTSNHLPVTIMLQFSATAGIDDFSGDKNTWALYPNPAKDELNISATADLADSITTIYDLTGRVVYTAKFSAAVNVSALPAGVYIVRIGTESRKFVKE